jgi:Zn-dependent protease
MFLAGIGIRIGIAMGAFGLPDVLSFTQIVSPTSPGLAGFAATCLSIIFVLNLLLFTFNLLPVPPLDGGTVVTLFMPESMALSFLHWMRTGGFAMIGLILAWTAFDKIFGFVFRFGLKALFFGLGAF